MKSRAALIIKQRIWGILFIGIALVMGLLIFWYINNLKLKIPSGDEAKQVVIASCDLSAGQTIEQDMVQLQDIPPIIYSERAIVDIQEAIGRECLHDLRQGEIIYAEHIWGSAEGDNSSYCSYIPPSKRLITVPVSYWGPAELLRPGERVDIVSVYHQPDHQEMFCQTIVSYQEMVMVDPGSQDDSGQDLWPEKITGGYGNHSVFTVSFYASPQQVEDLFLAMERGTLNLCICPRKLFNF